MKTEITKEYMLSNRGCYSRKEMLGVKCVAENNVSLENLFKDLPIKDFTWFLVKKCDLTLTEKSRFALYCAKYVLPIFEKEHPKDKRVRECIEAIELFLDDKISLKQLRIKRDAAYNSYTPAAAAYAAASATAASGVIVDVNYDGDYTTNAATSAATATAAATAVATAAAYAYADADTYAAADTAVYAVYAVYAYRQYIWEFVKYLTKTKYYDL